MNAGRAGAEAGPSRVPANAAAEPARKVRKKKGKEPIRPSIGPIPAPYLALAPQPVSNLSRTALDSFTAPSDPRLVLPSNYLRAKSTPNLHDGDAALASAAPRRAYAAKLAAPPLIVPGGTSATPRIQDAGVPAARRRGDGRRRSEESLRAMALANQSMASLGVLGRIMENEPTAAGGQIEGTATPPQRRRRRVVREETQSPQRQPTMTREEGRAMGLARGASMRRLNVWDDLPDAGEAPPPFALPTASEPPQNPYSRQPAIEHPPSPDEDPAPPFEARGRSPPPTWEQAMGLAPSPAPLPAPIAPTAVLPDCQIPVAPGDNAQSSSRPHLIISTPARPLSLRSSAPSSPDTHYASAPESPADTSSEEIGAVVENEERQAWLSDITAGYSFQERVERELQRRRRRSLSRRRAASPNPVSEQEVFASPTRSAGTETPRPSLGAGDNAVSPLKSLNGAVAGGRADVNVSVSPAIESSSAQIRPNTAIIANESAERAAAGEGAAGAVDDESQMPVTTTRSPVQRIDEEVATANSGSSAEPPSATIHVTSPPAGDLALEETMSGQSAQTIAGKHAGPTSRAVGTQPGIHQGSAGDTNGASDSPIAPAQSIVPARSEAASSLVDTSLGAGSAVVGSQQRAPSKPSMAKRKKAKKASKGAATNLDERTETTPTVDTERLSSDIARGKMLSRFLEAGSTPQRSSSNDQSGSSSANDDAANHTRHLTRPPQDTPIVETRSPEALAENAPTEDQKQETASTGGSDVAVVAAPTRKLTRGKAIRRSSSGLDLSPGVISRRRSTQVGSPRLPLFGDNQYGWQPAEEPPEPSSDSAPRIMPAHRASTSSLPTARTTFAASPVLPSFPRSGRMLGSLAQMESSTPDRPETPNAPSPSSPVMPPHREAALKRRELVSKLPDLPSPIAERSVFHPVPLIDLTERYHPPVTYRSPPPAVSRELLQLFGEDVPIAESSAQAAARMEEEGVLSSNEKQWTMDEQLEDLEDEPPTPPAKTSVKRPPPPPPPLRRVLVSTTAGANLTPRRSIIRTADSPVTPRPLRQMSIGSADRPTLPTRRPPPPPPTWPPGDSVDEDAAPPLPPRPAPSYRPAVLRQQSSHSLGESASSLSEQPATASTFDLKPGSPQRRPRGPRPLPPPRPWARAAMPLQDVKPPIRPPSERTQSDTPVSQREARPHQPSCRSTSEQNILASAGPHSPMEYTDLDVLVSRLEGSGREYEGFSQITAFLGPGKSLAASPEALATLLPGLISVDSRRVTAQGKVKLKLSLLGVRVSKCPVCLGQFKQDENAVLLPECGHISHQDCATRWFREDHRCFVCRVALLPEGRVDTAELADESWEESGNGRLVEGVI